MVVLQVVAPADFGGLERVAHALAHGLHGLGHDVHVAIVLDVAAERHPFLTPLADCGIATHALELPMRASTVSKGGSTSWSTTPGCRGCQRGP